VTFSHAQSCLLCERPVLQISVSGCSLHVAQIGTTKPLACWVHASRAATTVSDTLPL